MDLKNDLAKSPSAAKTPRRTEQASLQTVRKGHFFGAQSQKKPSSRYRGANENFVPVVSDQAATLRPTGRSQPLLNAYVAAILTSDS